MCGHAGLPATYKNVCDRAEKPVSKCAMFFGRGIGYMSCLYGKETINKYSCSNYSIGDWEELNAHYSWEVASGPACQKTASKKEFPVSIPRTCKKVSSSIDPSTKT